MRSLTFLAIAFLTNIGLAQEVNVEVKPENPVLDEPYELIFNIETQSDQKPFISFDPGRSQVMGKEKRGVSIRTTMVNGKFTTKRTLTYAYRLISSRTGIHTIRNIEVEIDGKTIDVGHKRYKVLKEAPKPDSLFVKADVSKKEAYVGEGIDLRYYLYFRRQVVGREIEKFPKLNGFIKRFHKFQDQVETIEYQGEIYRRLLVYSARLYPQEEGKAYVDPLRLKVQYTQSRRGSSLSGFGLQVQDYRSKSLSSKQIPINVKSLPAKNVPDSFSGLVGEHEFSISGVKGQYVVNEPIELTLSVKGPGALENLSSPKIYQHKALEQFDTQSKLNELGRERARKTFEYTYLGRSELKIKDQEFRYAYFDPQREEYIQKSLNLPSIFVRGGATSSSSGDIGGHKDESSSNVNSKNQAKEVKPTTQEPELLAPQFSEEEGSLISSIVQYMNYILFLAIFLLFGAEFIVFRKSTKTQRQAKRFISQINKEGLTYSALYSLITLLDDDDKNSRRSLKEILEQSSLDEASRGYFMNLVDECESGTYFKGSPTRNKKIKRRYAKQLIKSLRGKNENTHKPEGALGSPS